MISNIILLCHIFLYLIIAYSPFSNDYALKKLVIIFLLFLSFHFLSKYGKCGLINIERFFLKDNFKNGFIYKLIKPVICYKLNPIYNYFEIILIYILILYIQLDKTGYDLNIFTDIKLLYNDLLSADK